MDKCDSSRNKSRTQLNSSNVLKNGYINFLMLSRVLVSIDGVWFDE
jgi:hypothetical protein